MGSCGTCHGLWVPMSQLTPRLPNRASARLFHASGGRDTLLRCPVDGMAMREFEIDGVHIDRCSTCRGLWFDAGELATVLEATGYAAPRKQTEADDWRESAGQATEIAVEGAADLAFNADVIVDGLGDVVSAIAEFIGGAVL
jgi:Zn-finger nucleic acid-binding protein